MNLSPQTEVYGAPEDQTWLGSAHATDTGKTVTLDAASFSGFGDVIPSGVAIAEPATPGALSLRYTGAVGQEFAGHLLCSIRARAGVTNLPAALLWHGSVIVENLPTGHGLDAAAVTAAAGRIHYVGEVA